MVYEQRQVQGKLRQRRWFATAFSGRLCARHKNYRHFSITSTEAAAVEACPGCPADVFVTCAGCEGPVALEWCADRAAISRALTGEDGADG